MPDAVASSETQDVPESPETSENPAPETSDNPAPEADTSPDPAARIAELEKQLADAEPILQAARDAEEADKTDLQRAQERAAELESQLAESRREQMRASVAEKTGLPSSVVARFVGETEEDLVAAVNAVKEALAAQAPAAPNLRRKPAPRMGGSGSAGSGEAEESPNELAEQIRKRMAY